MNVKTKEFVKLKADRDARKAAHEEKLEKIAHEIKIAKGKATAAAAEFTAAKNALDASAMIEKKIAAQTTAEVVEVLEEELKAEKARDLYAPAEKEAAKNKIITIRDELEASANTAICKKLAELEQILINIDAKFDELKEVKKDIAPGELDLFTHGALVQNGWRDVAHAKQFFKEYWPK